MWYSLHRDQETVLELEWSSFGWSDGNHEDSKSAIAVEI